MTTCIRGRHGGFGAAATRRGEQMAMCGDCGERTQPRHQAQRVLAHSLADELPEPRQPIEPVVFTRRDLIEIVVGVPILGALMFGIPFLIWLIEGANR